MRLRSAANDEPLDARLVRLEQRVERMEQAQPVIEHRVRIHGSLGPDIDFAAQLLYVLFFAGVSVSVVHHLLARYL
ncbi:MAG: hypothetical protein Q7V62_17055 [Actinomycetota bacterium]|nr:hypothetical protein [Actinomycetota bacterium]